MNQGYEVLLRSFSIGQKVAVCDEEGLTARVQAILLNADGLQYQISYWASGIRHVEWVFPVEIRKA